MCSHPALAQIIWAEKDVRDDLVWLSHFTNKETNSQVGWPPGPTMTFPFLVLKGAGTTSFGKSFHAPPSITLSASKVCMWTSDVHSKRGRISSPEHLNGQSKGRPDSDGVDLKGNRKFCWDFSKYKPIRGRRNGLYFTNQSVSIYAIFKSHPVSWGKS